MENTPGKEIPVCSNCHLPVQENDAFCAQCGQKRYRRKLNLRDYLEDISNFVFNWDNRLIRTFKALLFQPGELTRAYFAGEHQRYLSPVRVLLYSFLLAVPMMNFDIDINGTSYSNHFSSLRSAMESWQMRDSLQDRMVGIEEAFKSDSARWSAYTSIRQTVFPRKEDSIFVHDNRVYLGDLLSKSPADLAEQYFPQKDEPWKEKWAFKKEAERLIQIESPNQKMLSRVIYVAFIALPIAGLISWLLHGRKRYNYLENLVMQTFLFCFLLWLLILGWVIDLFPPLPEFLSNVLSVLSYLLLIVYAFMAHKSYFKGPVWLHLLRSIVMVIALAGLFLSSTLVVFLFGAYVF